MVDAVIFDFDGTLVDSEPAYARADTAFVERLGGVHDEAAKHACRGLGDAAFIRMYAEKLGLDTPFDELLELKRSLFDREALDDIPLFPHMKAFMDRARAARVPLAVASASHMAYLEAASRRLGIRDYFDVIVSVDEVEHPKPEPDVFLEAARRIGVAPCKCLVFEDSALGVRAAKAAGMICVAVPETGRPEDFASADHIIWNAAQQFDAPELFARYFG